MSRAYIVAADPESLARSASEFVVSRLEAAVRSRGAARWMLAGGSTPRRLYEIVRDRSDIPWNRIALYWGDERCVPARSPDSNRRMVESTLLADGRVVPASVHPIQGDAPDPVAEAARYGTVVDDPGTSAPLSMDVVLLGVGPDGHVASLFPGTPELQIRDRSVAAVARSPVPPHVGRITVTFRLLDSARSIVVLAAGPEKRPVAEGVWYRDDGRLPAARLRPTEELRWFLDPAAAGDLDRREASAPAPDDPGRR